MHEFVEMSATVRPRKIFPPRSETKKNQKLLDFFVSNHEEKNKILSRHDSFVDLFFFLSKVPIERMIDDEFLFFFGFSKLERKKKLKKENKRLDSCAVRRGKRMPFLRIISVTFIALFLFLTSSVYGDPIFDESSIRRPTTIITSVTNPLLGVVYSLRLPTGKSYSSMPRIPKI
jgi:hypothetical protein